MTERARLGSLTQRCESMHVDREILDNRLEAEVLRILDMADGLLQVVEALGNEPARLRAARARHELMAAQLRGAR